MNLIDGRYRVLEDLGRGASGAVYRAFDLERGIEVAVKVLFVPSNAPPALLQRFQREVRALTKLDHPHVVTIYAAGEDQGRPYLVTQLIPGVTLDERLQRGGALSSPEAGQLTLKLARALQHAHSHAVLHRDVKPGNVILTASGEPLLADFGLAKHMDSGSVLSREGALMGTPGYWPPEQARGRLDEVGPASDVFGLGATLYAALTRRPPFVGETLSDLIAATERGVVPPSQVVPGVDPALEAICIRCLASSPADRFESAEALALALTGYLTPASATDDGADRRPWGLVAGLSGFALAATILISGVLTRRDPLPQTPSELVGDSTPDVSEQLAGHLEQASLSRKAGDYEAALTAAEAACALAPDSARAHAHRAYILMRLTRLDEALRAAERAVVDPQLGAGYRYRGMIRAALRDFPAALADFGRAIALDPTDTKAFLSRAVAHNNQDEFLAAVSDCERALELQDSAHGHYVYAYALLHLERYTDAKLSASRAIQRDPDHASAYYIRGCAKHDEGNPAQAIPDFDRSIELDDSLGTRRARLLSLRKAGRIDDALREVELLLQAQPDNWNHVIARAGLHYDLRDFEAALPDYEHACKLVPDGWSAHYNRGQCLRYLGRYDEAIQAYTVAYELSGDLDALYNRGISQQKHGLSAAAAADFQTYIEARPDEAQPWSWLGDALSELGDDQLAAALEAYDRSIELDSDDPATWVNRGVLYSDLGRIEDAVADYSHALELDPNNVNAICNRGINRHRLGDEEGAVKDLEQGLALLEPNRVSRREFLQETLEEARANLSGAPR